MRKYVFIAAVALASAFALSACSKSGESEQTAQQTTKATRPADMSDTKGWNAYLGQLVSENLQGMTSNRPYAYMVPAGDTPEDQAGRDRQLSNVQDTVARGVLPGNLLAFAGPDSAKTADLIITAFTDARPGTFKDVIVVFIGDQADQQRVADVLKPSGATFRFVQM